MRYFIILILAVGIVLLAFQNRKISNENRYLETDIRNINNRFNEIEMEKKRMSSELKNSYLREDSILNDFSRLVVNLDSIRNEVNENKYQSSIIKRNTDSFESFFSKYKY